MNNNIILLILVLLLYGLGNFYVGWRGWQGLRLQRSRIGSHFYKVFVCLLALAYPLARLGETYLPELWIDKLTFLGALWLGTLYYLFLLTVCIDLIRLANKRINFLPQKIKNSPLFLTLTVICLTMLLIGYGTWNARHPITRNYEITIPKQAGSLDTLQVVMVSDLHLGNLITNKQLTKLVNRINQLDPDLVLFAGDIIDSKVDVLPKQNMMENFARLKPKFGTYGILGNHEYFERKPELAIQYLEQGQVHMLRDQAILIADAFYLVGRDDLSKKRATGMDRQELNTIMANVDHKAPIILLDHQPHQLQDGVEAGVDLQFSGHTHLGQLFPNNLLTQSIYELDWGYLKKESMQVFVSCGIGTWGPPIRIGNQPEILNITIHFEKPEK